MAHRRKPLALALGLNTVVLVAEVAGGVQANSLSLIIDGVHLVALVIALVIVVTTVRSVLGSHKELLWPENVVCGHSEGMQAPNTGPLA